MMGRWYPPASPPAVHPTGRVSGGRGEALAAVSAAGRRRGPGPGGGRARAVRVVAGIDQRLGSCPRSRRVVRPGRDVAGAGLDDVSRVGTRTGRFPSAGRSTSPSFRSGALEGGEGASWRRMVSAGGVRAGSEGGCGLGMTRSSSAAIAALTTPNSRLGGPGRSRSGRRVIQRRRGRAFHSPRAC